MNTVDMIRQARVNGKMYQYDENTFYTSATGFIDADGEPRKCSDVTDVTINDLLGLQWHIIETMTRQEAEEHLGVKIVG